MSEEQHTMSEMLQEKFSSKAFPFDEENWEKMERRIDRERNGKKRRRAALIFLFGLFAGVLIMLPFVNFPVRDDKKGQDLAGLQKMDHVRPVPVKKDPADDQGYFSPLQKNGPVKEQHSAAPELTIQPPRFVKDDKVKTSGEQSKKNTSDAPAPVVEIKTGSSGNVPAPVYTTDTSAANSVTAVRIPVKEKKDSSILFSHFSKDTLTVPSPNTLKPEQLPQAPVNSSTYFTFDAGVKYELGWSYHDTTEGKGFTPLFGMGVTHLFNTHWGIIGGVRYARIGQLNAPKVYRSETKGFGLSITDSIIDTRTLHYLEIPLTLQYTLNDRNSIGLGGTFGFLVNTTSYFMTRMYSDFNTVQQTKERSLGYKKGYDPLNLSLHLLYRRRISDKFTISAAGFYGLTDLREDDFFARAIREREKGIELTLTYSILKKN